MAGRVASPRLVGRRAELAVLQSSLAAVTSAGSATVLVAGEAGLGKTRLLGEFAAEASRTGTRVLMGACVALGGENLPYAPFTQALGDMQDQVGRPGVEALAGPGRSELARLLPDLRHPEDGVGAAAPADRGALFHAVLRTLDRLADGAPTALVMEDLHWADTSSLELLGFLISRLRGQVLVVGTYRTDEVHRRHPLRPFLAETARSPRVRRLDLPPLTGDEIAEQVEAILGAPPTDSAVGAVVARAAGNPFFAEELLAAGAGDELPPNLAQVLAARLAALPEPAQEIVAVAAVGGARVGHDLLASVAASRGIEVGTGLREAISHHVLVAESSGAYVFRHALLQEAAYEEMLPAERASLHSAYARALAERPDWATTLRGGATELAHHLVAAGDAPRALAACVAAAAVAAQTSAFAEAQALYEHALGLWDRVPAAADLVGCDRPELLARTADAAFLAGARPRAVALVRTALVELDAGAHPTRAALLQERLARLLWISADGEGSLAAIRAAVGLMPDEPSLERARILGSEARTLMLCGRYEESRARAETARDVARSAGARREEGDILNTLGVALGRTGRAAEAIPLLEQAVLIADAVGSGEDVRRAYNNLGAMLDDAAGEPARAVEVGLAGAARCEQLGYQDGFLHLCAGAAMILLDLAEWDRAQALAATVLAGAGEGITAWRARLTCGLIALRRGDLSTAHDHLRRAHTLIAQSADVDTHCFTGTARAELALTEGLPDDAAEIVLKTLAALGRVDGPDAVRMLAAAGLRATADSEAGAPTGRRPDSVTVSGRARELYQRAVATRSGGPTTLLGDALDALCEAEWSRVTATPDPAAWAGVAAAWLRIPRPYEATYARWRQGEAHLAVGDKDAAAAALREALATANRLGAEPLAGQVEAVGRRARLRLTPTPTRDTPDPGGLTAREHEVLGLLAEGRTNRQIASALFMSEKTASVHVSRILAKLGVANRGQAAAVARRRGLAATAPPSNG